MSKKSSAGGGLFLLVALFGSTISAAFSWLIGNIALIAAAVLTIFVVLALMAVQSARRKRRDHEAWVAHLKAKYKSDSVVQRILNSEIWPGQSAAQLIDSRGEPAAKDEKVLKTKRREVWKYDEIRKNQYALRITVENGKVASWEQKGS